MEDIREIMNKETLGVEDLLKLKYSENTKQETSSSDLVSDTRELGTGCSSEASGTMESKELDAAPLGHKIEAKEVCHCESELDRWNCDNSLCLNRPKIVRS